MGPHVDAAELARATGSKGNVFAKREEEEVAPEEVVVAKRENGTPNEEEEAVEGDCA